MENWIDSIIIFKDSISLTVVDKTPAYKHVVTDTQTSNPQTSNPATSMSDTKQASSLPINWKPALAITWIALFLFILIRFLLYCSYEWENKGEE